MGKHDLPKLLSKWPHTVKKKKKKEYKRRKSATFGYRDRIRVDGNTTDVASCLKAFGV